MAKPTTCDNCGKDCTVVYYEVESEGEELTLGKAIIARQFDRLQCIGEYFSRPEYRGK